MKKYWWIILIVICVVVFGIIESNATYVAEERMDGIGDNNYWKAYEYLEEFCEVWYPKALEYEVDENGVYYGYGIIYGDEFEFDYGLKCTRENAERMVMVMNSGECKTVDIAVTGFIEGNTVYKMEIEPMYEQIDGIDCKKAVMIFMVVYED